MQMRREMAKADLSQESQVNVEEQVSDEFFQCAASRAWAATLQLAVMCSKFKKQELCSMLKMAKADPNFHNFEDDHQAEDCSEASASSAVKADGFLQHIRDGQAFAAEALGPLKTTDLPTDGEALLVEETAKQPDLNPKIADATEAVCECEDSPEFVSEKQNLTHKVNRAGKFTLSLALQGCETFEESKNNLWLLLCYLRLHPHGCDADIIKNALHTRSRVSKDIPKWHNFVRHQLSVQEAPDKLPGTRTSRQAAWVEHCEQLRKKLSATLPSTLTLNSGNVLACVVRGVWHPCLLLAIWRVYKKGNGSQLTLPYLFIFSCDIFVNFWREKKK